jgi:hypothetical protein
MFEILIGEPNPKGKRSFCSDTDAVKAGFRPARAADISGQPGLPRRPGELLDEQWRLEKLPKISVAVTATAFGLAVHGPDFYSVRGGQLNQGQRVLDEPHNNSSSNAFSSFLSGVHQ